MKNSKDDMLHIGPDYAISGNEDCVTLYKRRITDKGKVQYDAKGYFMNHKQLLRKMVDMELNQVAALDQLVKTSDYLKHCIDDLCDKCGLVVPSEPDDKTLNKN